MELCVNYVYFGTVNFLVTIMTRQNTIERDTQGEVDCGNTTHW